MLCRFFLGGRRWVFSNYFPAKSKTFYPQIINKMTGLLTSNCHFMQKEKFGKTRWQRRKNDSFACSLLPLTESSFDPPLLLTDDGVVGDFIQDVFFKQFGPNITIGTKRVANITFGVPFNPS